MAQDSIQTSRRSYRSSGQICWARFLPCALLTWLVAAVLAVVLYVAFRAGFYFIIVAPALAALPVVGMLIFTVSRGHCRSRLVAGITGAVAGVILYLGYFYVGMIHEIGLSHANRVDLLPGYVKFRMNSDVSREAGSSRDESHKKPDNIGNWFAFTLESAMVLLFTIGGGVGRARRAYCERCGDWMQQELAAFAPGKGKTIVEAFEAGSIAALAAAPTVPMQPNGAYTVVSVEFCKNYRPNTSPCPSYLSVKETSRGGGAGKLQQFELAMGKMLLRRIELAPEELVALTPRFRTLESLTGTSGTVVMQQLGLATSPVVQASKSAQVIPVPAPFANRLLSKKQIVINNLFVIVPLLTLFGGIGLAALGGYVAFRDDPANSIALWEKVCGIALIAGGVLLFGASAFIGVTNVGVLALRRARRNARNEFAQRPAQLADHGDSESWFVEVVPRENWYRLMLETATDVGFLRVDTKQKEILFDGDKECYRIPAKSILSCEIEEIIRGQETGHPTKRYVIVVRVNRDNQEWEVPFNPLGTDWIVTTRKRADSALKLHQAIGQILTPVSSSAPPV